MAHNISRANGRDEIAYAGVTPWHGLGVQANGLQTPAGMLTLAGMDWTVSTTPIYVKGPAILDLPGDVEVEGFRAIRRDDNNVILGVVSDRYCPIQNAQNGEIMDALVTEGGALIEVAGALGKGETCWMLARLPETFEVVAGDPVEFFMLLAWGHDGRKGVAGKLTKTRVVCQNTLGAALPGKWSKVADIYLKHTKNASLQIEQARKALGLLKKEQESTVEAFRLLAATPMPAPVAADYFKAVFPVPVAEALATQDEKDAFDAKLDRWNAHQAEVLRLFEAGKGQDLPGVAGTAWAGYNAVTEWIDHVYPVLQSGQVSQIRQQSVLFGSYGETKARALALAMDLAEAK